MERLRTLDDSGIEIPSLNDQMSEAEQAELMRLLCDHSQGNRGSYSVRSQQKIPAVVTHTMPDVAINHSVHIEYYNGTGKDVTVGERIGLRTTLRPNLAHTSRWLGTKPAGFFLVRVRRVFNYESFITISDLWHSDGQTCHSLDVEPLSDAMVLHKELRDSGVNDSPHRVVVTIEYRFAEREFTDVGGNLYCPELDLVLSTAEPNLMPPHPYNLLGNRQLMFKEDPAMRAMTGFQYRLLIIDNAKRYGDRFVFINDHIHHVKPERSGILRDGAWLFTSPSVKDNHAVPSEPVAQWFSLEQMDEALNLYRTYEEAITRGTVEARAALLEREKHEYNLELTREKRLRLEAERLLDTETHERAREMAERNREITILKDELELRAHRRKESLDWLKFIPAMITGLAGLFVTLVRAFTPTPAT